MIYKERFQVAGISYRKANLRKIIEWLEYDYEPNIYEDNGYLNSNNSEYYTRNVILEREPQNEFDKNAIKVLVGKIHLGYVPKKLAKKLAKLLDSKYKYIADLELIEDYNGNLDTGILNVILFDSETLPNEVPENIYDLDDKVIPLKKDNTLEDTQAQNNVQTELSSNPSIVKTKNDQRSSLIVGFVILLFMIALTIIAILNQ